MSGPALVALAHGSRDPAAARVTEALAAEVRRQRVDLGVTVAYLEHAAPALSDVLDHVGPSAVVVPLLLSGGFHSAVDIPAQLSAHEPGPSQAAVLGPHPLLVQALERRLAEVGVSPGEAGTGVVLAAAGSTDPAAAEAVGSLAALWERQRGWRVQPAFASSASPSVEDAVAGLRGLGVRRVVVASYLLFPGLFADRLADSGVDAVSGPLGDAPEVAAVVLQRYDDAVAALEGEGAARR